jgi:hypothetical protein
VTPAFFPRVYNGRGLKLAVTCMENPKLKCALICTSSRTRLCGVAFKRIKWQILSSLVSYKLTRLWFIFVQQKIIRGWKGQVLCYVTLCPWGRGFHHVSMVPNLCSGSSTAIARNVETASSNHATSRIRSNAPGNVYVSSVTSLVQAA